MDGDSDLELNGDEADGSLGEDDFHMHNDCMRYPGCPCSDPTEDDDSDFCLAGDDGVFAGPAIIADALGFSSRPSRYAVSMDGED